MRLAGATIVLAGLWLAGCTGNALDCAAGVPHGDCATGSAGYQVKMQAQQDDKTVSEIDDARCLAYGEPGSGAYAECRRRAASARESFAGPKPH